MIFAEILNKNKVLLKSVSNIFIVLNVLLLPLYGSSSKTYPFTYNHEYPVQFHRSSIFVVSQQSSKTLEKRSILGALLWKIVVDSPIKQFSCRFDSVFILDQDGVLTVLNNQEGYKKWSIQDHDFLDIYIQFPYLIYRTKTNKWGSLSFNDGQLLWEKTIKPNVDMGFIGHSGQFALVYRRRLDCIDLVQGDTRHKIKLPDDAISIETAWNKGLIIRGKTDFYHVNMETQAVNPIVINNTPPNGGYIQEHYQLAYNKKEAHIMLREIVTGETVWTTPVSPSLTDMTVSRRDVLLQYTPTHNEVLSWLTPSRNRTKVTVPEGKINYFYREGNSFLTIVDDTITHEQIIKEKE